MVQGDQGRHVLRPVLGTVRQGPRLYADRDSRRERSGIRGLGRSGEEEVCKHSGEFLRIDRGCRAVSASTDKGGRARDAHGRKADGTARLKGFENGHLRCNT